MPGTGEGEPNAMPREARSEPPEAVEQHKDERPDVPSEASLRTEQICEHQRKRFQSALGLAVSHLSALWCQRRDDDPDRFLLR